MHYIGMMVRDVPRSDQSGHQFMTDGHFGCHLGFRMYRGVACGHIRHKIGDSGPDCVTARRARCASG